MAEFFFIKSKICNLRLLVYYYYYYYYYYSPLAQSRRHDSIEVRDMCSGCNGVSFGNDGYC